MCAATIPARMTTAVESTNNLAGVAECIPLWGSGERPRVLTAVVTG